ncbi:amidohydrolase family protein [Conexibacter arvalis]|uniref:Cytosine/adenosine deaminase-related metal-dependent hydrolase n=1 Tax=Conexibacter arvalis TaxID=912552 RepID=A0A840IEX4_9ACTN|nr:amidohydrolase family protein [Conexibacter arvalis]MBB4662865.1 cytosine/adenosine deaminase-related metal-dependent hydrolase [Conexibacter arvalis]
MSSERTLIRGGLVLVGDPRDKRMERADVLVEEGRIAALQPDLQVADARVIDAAGKWVLPGFVDAHHHLWQATMRAVCADWNLNDYFWCIRRNHATVHTPEDVYAGVLSAGYGLLTSGVTCTIDFCHCIVTPEHADEGLRAFRELGIRGVWCYGMYSPPVEEGPLLDFEARVADLHRVREREFSAQDDLVRLGIAPAEMGVVPFAQTKAEFALARELDVLLHPHTNCRWRPAGEELREVEIWHEHGMLHANQLHSHANTCSDHELQLLARSGGAVSGTPDTELGMGLGFTICGRADAAGVTTGIGADTQCNNGPDPFVGMRLVLQSERIREQWPILTTEGLKGVDKLNVTVADVLHMATLGSARGMGLGDVCGSLEVGKAADVLVFDADQPHLRPVIDPVSTIVLHGGVADLTTIMVGGRVVKQDGRLVGYDLQRANRLIDEAGGRVADAVEARGGWYPPVQPDLAEATDRMRAANLAGVY